MVLFNNLFYQNGFARFRWSRKGNYDFGISKASLTDFSK